MTAYIDLRSDTVTRPTPGMLEAMMTAPTGDDVFGEDPTVNALQEKMAAMFGMENALFCPSGTMANQIAIKVHTLPMDEVICEEKAHVYLYEAGGIAFNSAASVQLLKGDRGRISAAQVETAIRPDDVHFPKSSLVCLENTSNKGGGSCYDPDEIGKIKAVCRQHGLKFHLDGARLFNAMVKQDLSAEFFGGQFDSISICLSKGLGAPVGSVLIGDKAFIKQARRVRKVMGGGMRQAGVLAAACIYALDHHVDRLREDHVWAEQIGRTLQVLNWVEELMPVDTNIVAFRLKNEPEAARLRDFLKENQILAVSFGPAMVRMVTHLDVGQDDINSVCEVLKAFS